MKRNTRFVIKVVILLLFAIFAFITQQDITETPKDAETVDNVLGVENGFYKVTKVIDGDTIEVLIAGKKEKVRLIGIDTPEVVDPRKPVQCYGKEASEKAKSLLIGKMISLESDSTQSDRDNYKRLLRYVFLEDKTHVNLLMIQEGYAHEYTYKDNPYKYQEEFRKAEREAREKELGLWGEAC